MTDKQDELKAENKALKKQNKELEKELTRKEKALAEVVAEFNRTLVLQRLEHQRLARVTLDFDGSVISNGRYAEGTAIGYNDKKKGTRSYYPLFCTVAQSGQVLDAYHRPGNVHDSNGSLVFIGACVAAVRAQLPGVIVESRKDSAFFSSETVAFMEFPRSNDHSSDASPQGRPTDSTTGAATPYFERKRSQRNSPMHASPIALPGTTDRNAALQPNRASPAATLTSFTATKRRLESRGSEARRSITSPKVR